MSRVRSGQITVTTAGTAVPGPDLDTQGRLILFAAAAGNTEVVFVGNDGAGDVDSSNGFPLTVGAPPIQAIVDNLNQMFFDAGANGQKIAWFDAGPV